MAAACIAVSIFGMHYFFLATSALRCRRFVMQSENGNDEVYSSDKIPMKELSVSQFRARTMPPSTRDKTTCHFQHASAVKVNAKYTTDGDNITSRNLEVRRCTCLICYHNTGTADGKKDFS